MRTYLIHTSNDSGKRTGAIVKFHPRDFTGEQYGEMRSNFASQYGKTNPASVYDKYADMTDLWEQTDNGVWFDEELAGPGGCSFMLIKLPETTEEQLKAAAEEIRRKRDVVRLFALNIDTLVDYAIEIPAAQA